jgi:16S rRNA (cytosine1402-N4)-methyltransferase
VTPGGLIDVGARAQPLGQQERGPLLHPPGPLYPGRNPGTALVEGLRTSLLVLGESEHTLVDALVARDGRQFEHRPVMVNEVVDLFASVPAGVVLDATVGGGGHANAVLGSREDVRLVGLDRDPEAVGSARSALAAYGKRATVTHERFDNLASVLARFGVEGLSGALFDLGVSSPQVDNPGRGFSYRLEAPLDMRMDQSQNTTAADVVNSWPEARLAELFASHGEARFARRIAGAVVAARPLRTTLQLAEVVAAAVPAAARRRGHPAKRVFQALRVAVNNELEVLPGALDTALELLVPEGRLVVISYHSGEDRLVKERLRAAATGGCTCPPGLPCACGAVARVRVLTSGARMPGAAELLANPRARSARLRAAEKLAGQGRPL